MLLLLIFLLFFHQSSVYFDYCIWNRRDKLKYKPFFGSVAHCCSFLLYLSVMTILNRRISSSFAVCLGKREAKRKRPTYTIHVRLKRVISLSRHTIIHIFLFVYFGCRQFCCCFFNFDMIRNYMFWVKSHCVVTVFSIYPV